MAKGLCWKCLNYGFNCKNISSNPDVEITVCEKFWDISKGHNLVKTTDKSKREVNNKDNWTVVVN